MEKINAIFVASVLIGAGMLSSCKDDNGKLPDSALIYINGRDVAPTKQASVGEQSPSKRTALEVCQAGDVCIISVVSPYETSGAYRFMISPPPEATSVGVIDVERRRLNFRAEAIGDIDTHPFFREEHPLMILDNRDASFNDTLAYVPTAQRMAVVGQLKELFKDKERNWSEIYRIFNDAFIFVPCTGAEYKKLVEEGRN